MPIFRTGKTVLRQGKEIQRVVGNIYVLFSLNLQIRRGYNTMLLRNQRPQR